MGSRIGVAWMAEVRQIRSVVIADDIPWFAKANRKVRWLVGVSGGADSVALLHMLAGAGFRNLVVCHLDHRLRGRASTEDAAFVRRLADSLGLACEIGREDVRARMAKLGESMETAARDARHDFFAECAVTHWCRRVILAHHADDQAETVLWNLLRGSHGLKGMKEEQDITVGAGIEIHLIRPLLGVKHADLVGWLTEQGHRWREDASNEEPVAVRNRLRKEVFPLLADISGRDVAAAFVRGAADTTEREIFECEMIEQAGVLDPRGRMHLPALRTLSPYMQRAALRKFLTDHGIPSIDRSLLERVSVLVDVTKPAVVNLPGGRKLRRREARLWIEG